MNRTPLFAGLALVAALGLGACGSDLKTSTANKPTVTTADGSTGTTVGGGGSPAVTTMPGAIPGVSGDCADLYKQMIAAFGSASAGTTANLGEMFGKLESFVPDDLKDDVKVLSKAYGQFSDVLKKYSGDMSKAMTDPEVQKAIQAIGTPEVQAASDNLNKYFETKCPSK
jgi:hypothetical protein